MSVHVEFVVNYTVEMTPRCGRKHINLCKYLVLTLLGNLTRRMVDVGVSMTAATTPVSEQEATIHNTCLLNTDPPEEGWREYNINRRTQHRRVRSGIITIHNGAALFSLKELTLLNQLTKSLKNMLRIGTGLYCHMVVHS